MFETHNYEFQIIPDAGKFINYLDWIKRMQDNQTPQWIGLPNNIEMRKREQEAKYLVEKL